eukprot:5497079-Pleurochrysis_carterae.AAC.1
MASERGRRQVKTMRVSKLYSCFSWAFLRMSFGLAPFALARTRSHLLSLALTRSHLLALLPPSLLVLSLSVPSVSRSALLLRSSRWCSHRFAGVASAMARARAERRDLSARRRAKPAAARAALALRVLRAHTAPPRRHRSVQGARRRADGGREKEGQKARARVHVCVHARARVCVCVRACACA